MNKEQFEKLIEKNTSVVHLCGSCGWPSQGQCCMGSIREIKELHVGSLIEDLQKQRTTEEEFKELGESLGLICHLNWWREEAAKKYFVACPGGFVDSGTILLYGVYSYDDAVSLKEADGPYDKQTANMIKDVKNDRLIEENGPGLTYY